MYRKIKFILVGIISTGLLTGCGQTNIVETKNNDKIIVYNQSEEEKDLLDILKSSKNIVLEEKFIKAKKDYKIIADGKEVGRISGKYINLMGEVLELSDMEGNVKKIEKQSKRWGVKINRMGSIQNVDGSITGYIGEEKIEDMFKIGHRYHIYNSDREEIGTSKEEIFTVTKKMDIYDMDGNIDYEIDEKVLSLTNSFDIKIKDNSNINVEDILFYTVIQNEISNSKESKGGNE